jgi:hypothetical protein
VEQNNQIKYGGSVKNERAKSIRALFERYYDNKIAVVALEQQGSYGKTVHITAKADLSEMNRNTLRFYSFDINNNRFAPINPPPKFYIDEKKALHFETNFAGDIVITDRPLIPKAR